MVEIKVDASKLKKGGVNAKQLLADFLKEKAGGEVVNDGGMLLVKTEAVGVSKKYVRVLLKKFLHQSELKNQFRVISGEEDVLTVKERREYEEED